MRPFAGGVITALKSQALLNESVGAGYIERNWPPALKDSGAWPLSSLRQSFLNGSLRACLDPDTTLRGKIVEFVSRGDFGLASGQKPDGGYERVLFNEFIDPAEVTFESGVFLLLKAKAKAVKARPEPGPGGVPEPGPTPEPWPTPEPGPQPEPEPAPGAANRTFCISGDVPPEIWNRLGTKVLPKLRSGSDLKIGIEFSVTVDGQLAGNFKNDLMQIIEDLGLTGTRKDRLEWRGNNKISALSTKRIHPTMKAVILKPIMWNVNSYIRPSGVPSFSGFVKQY